MLKLLTNTLNTVKRVKAINQVYTS